MEIEYRCPMHGKVEPRDREVPSCPVSIVRTIGGKPSSETCALPLSASPG